MIEDLEPMSSKDAVLTIASKTEHKSRYAICKALSYDGLRVTVTQISRYLKGHRMSRKVADRVFDVFGIVVSDVYEAENIADSLKRK